MKFNKEKPAATPRERLAAVEDALKELPHQYHIEFVAHEDVREQSVYVNYDFNTAVVIGWDDKAKMFELEALHWDQTHGIDDEHEIGLLADASIAAQVAVQFAKEHETL